MYSGTYFIRGTRRQNESQGTMLKKLSKNAKTFIKEKAKHNFQVQTFKSLLTHYMLEQDRQVDRMNDETTKQSFPWIFDGFSIPIALVTILFSIVNKVPFQTMTQAQFDTVDIRTIRSVAEKAVFQSKSQGAPYLDIAMRQYTSWVNQSVTRAFINLMRTSWQQLWGSVTQNGQAQLKEMLDKILPYGKYLINVQYLIRYGIVQAYQVGKIYFLATVPQLRFRVGMGRLDIFWKSESGQYSRIPQQMFTQDLLKRIIKEKIVSESSQIIRTFNDEYNGQKKELEGRKNFIQKYINRTL